MGGWSSGSVRGLSSMRLMTDKEGQQATGQIISGKGGLSRTCPLLDLTAARAVQRHNRGLHTSLLDLTAARAVQLHSRGLHTSLLDLTAARAVQRHNRGLHTSLLDLTAARAVQRHSRGLHFSAIAAGRPEFLAIKYSDKI